MPLVTIDYDMGVPGVEIVSMVALGLGARLVASPRKEGWSHRMSRFEEALLRLAEASAGEPYFGVGPEPVLRPRNWCMKSNARSGAKS